MKKFGALLVIGCLLSSVLFSQAPDTINQVDKNGLKQGYWEKKYPNGKYMYQGYFKNNKPVGLMKRYFDSGEIKAEMRHSEKSDTTYVKMFYEYAELASEGAYVNSKKQGEWKYYSYYDKSLKSIETYKNGIKDGDERTYYSDGTIAELIQWKKGKKEGEWKQYFQNGKIKLEGSYKEDKLNGSFKLYLVNGAPEVIGFYTQNKLNGKWVYYNDKGEVEAEIEYKEGKPLNEEIINEKYKAFFEKMDENIGKIKEPQPEDLLPQR